MARLISISISGFRSIRNMKLDLGDINVLIGANGAGKSNFASFFEMLNHMMTGALGRYIGKSGGADSQLFYGAGRTQEITAELSFETERGKNWYVFTLSHSAGDRLVFLEEVYSFSSRDLTETKAPRTALGVGHFESELREREDSTARFIRSALNGCRFFQFHDTSQTAIIKQTGNIDDNRLLKSNAGNLAAFLYLLKNRYPKAYHRIRHTIRRIIPFFDDFLLEPSRMNEQLIQLEWREKEQDTIFGPHQLSDGSLRFMALTTLLLQPLETMPNLIIIDEPELGLHPLAIKLLASMVRSASASTQIILSTQSKALVDEFSLADIVVVERARRAEGAETVFRRPDAASFASWLEAYTVSDLWAQNLIGGRPQ